MTFFSHRGYNIKWWKTLLYWLIDISQTNAFIIYRYHFDPYREQPRLHEQFYGYLVNALVTMPLEAEEVFYQSNSSKHERERIPQQRRCVNCSSNLSTGSTSRRFGMPIVNNSRKKLRSHKPGPRTRTQCKTCKKALCSQGDCWEQWHSKYSVN